MGSTLRAVLVVVPVDPATVCLVQYLGGKSKISKWLVAAMRPHLRGREFWDPFCGGLSMSLALSEAGARGVASDANPALIALYRAVVDGWDPPDAITEDEYRAARVLPDSDPRKAFVGFACSFGGKWFGGYARNNKGPNYAHDYARSSAAILKRDIALLLERGVSIALADFLEVEPEPTKVVLYLDPPYVGTTRYAGMGVFDRARFVRRVAAWSRHTDVFVSEYEMPPELGGRLAMEFPHQMQVAGGTVGGARVERLFHYGPGLPLGFAPCAHARIRAMIGVEPCPACNKDQTVGVVSA